MTDSSTVQLELEKAHEELSELRRELLSTQNRVQQAEVEVKEAESAVAQRDAKIESLLQAAKEDETLTTQLREEQASHFERMQRKAKKEKE